MTIAGRYELENILGSQNEAFTKPNFPFDKQYFKKNSVLHMSRRFQKNYTWETPNDPL